MWLRFFLFLHLWSISSVAVANAEPEWVKLARHVGEAEAHRPRAIRQLKKIKGLNKILVKGLDSPAYRTYALDIISAMDKKNLIPELLERAPRDADGFLILTASSLITKDNLPQFKDAYLKALEQPDVSAGALVAMLEPLGRLNIEISQDRLTKLMTHEYPEVRSAALDYIRTKTLKHNNSNSLSLLEKAFADSDSHQRFQAYTFATELRKEDAFKSRVPSVDCEKEKRGEVKSQCLNAKGENQAVVIDSILPEMKMFTMYVVFGYKDSRPARFVGDRHERLAFVQKLVSPCVGEDEACGFIRNPENSDLFKKEIKTESGKSRSIRLLVAHSAAGTDDQANRENPYQALKTQYARQSFAEGIKKADAVFYNGHSRFGGGPDFKPPLLDSEGAVNNGLYKNFTPGLATLSDEVSRRMRTSKRPLKVLGLFSCASTQHFEDEIKSMSKTRLITSTKVIHYSEALAGSVKYLAVVLNEQK